MATENYTISCPNNNLLFCVLAIFYRLKIGYKSPVQSAFGYRRCPMTEWSKQVR